LDELTINKNYKRVMSHHEKVLKKRKERSYSQCGSRESIEIEK